MAQMVKHLPTMRETRVQFLARNLLEKEMATHSSILAWKIPWTEEPARLQSEVAKFFLSLYPVDQCIRHLKGAPRCVPTL